MDIPPKLTVIAGAFWVILAARFWFVLDEPWIAMLMLVLGFFVFVSGLRRMANARAKSRPPASA